MGLYIEVPKPKDKINQIAEMFTEQGGKVHLIRGPMNSDVRGEILSDPDGFNKILKDMPWAMVCVVDNGPFEAAAWIYSADEALAFSLPEDFRPKRWMTIEPKSLIEEHCNHKLEDLDNNSRNYAGV